MTNGGDTEWLLSMNGSVAARMEKNVKFQSMIDLAHNLQANTQLSIGRSVSTGDVHYLK